MTEERKDGTGETLRGVVIIVLVGVLLGVGYNALGRASRPPRGLDWVKRERKLPSLEELQGGGGGTGGATVTPAGAGAPAPAAVETPAPPGEGSADLSKAGGATGTEKKAAPVKAVPVKAVPAQPAPSGPVPGPTGSGTPPAAAAQQAVSRAAAAQQAVNPAPAADLPVVPDRNEPIEIQLATVKKFFDAKAAVFVDSREAPEFVEGHIAGAQSLPFDDVVAKPALLSRLKGAGKPIIIYCGGGDCELSKSLAWNMLDAGIRKVLVYTGGFKEWQAAGHPVAKGAP